MLNYKVTDQLNYEVTDQSQIILHKVTAISLQKLSPGTTYIQKLQNVLL